MKKFEIYYIPDLYVPQASLRCYCFNPGIVPPSLFTKFCFLHYVFYHILVSVDIRIRKYTCTKMEKKNTNKNTRKMECVWWWGCLYVKCRSVWYSLKSVAKLYITSKHSTLSLSTEHIYMVEKAKNKNQPCDVVYVKKSAGDIWPVLFLKVNVNISNSEDVSPVLNENIGFEMHDQTNYYKVTYWWRR